MAHNTLKESQMNIHAPVFLGKSNRKTTKKFTEDTRADVIATIEFLYKRGMWSKYHYEKWLEEAKICKDEAILHGWWDAIVGGAMYEIDLENVNEMRGGLADKLMRD